MKFNEWISQEVKSCEAKIKDFKKSIEELQSEVKEEQQQKRGLGQKNDPRRELRNQIDEKIISLKAQIDTLKTQISVRKSSITDFKNLSKMKPVRLKTGAVVNLKIIDEMLKKLSGKSWSFEYTQYPDGLQIAYINVRTGSKGSFKVYHMVAISESVDLPLFEKGDISECSIHL